MKLNLKTKIFAIAIALIVTVGVAAAIEAPHGADAPQATPTPTPTLAPTPTPTPTPIPTPSPTPFIYPAHFNFAGVQTTSTAYFLQGYLFCNYQSVFGQVDLVNVDTGQVLNSTRVWGSFGEFDFYLPLDSPPMTVEFVFNGDSSYGACTSSPIQIP